MRRHQDHRTAGDSYWTLTGRWGTALVGVLWAWLLVGSSAGATNDLSAQYIHRVWSRDNGLPDNRVFALCQDRSGYLWIGTLNGLARFDGLEFKVFTRAEYPQMETDRVLRLAADGGDLVGVSRELHIIRWDGQRLTCQPRRRFPDVPFAFCGARGSGLWAAGGHTVMRLRQGVITYHEQQEAGGNSGGAILEAEDGSVWWGVSQLARFHPTTGRHELRGLPEALQGKPNWKLHGLHVHPAGGLVVVLADDYPPLNSQLYHYDTGARKWTPLTEAREGNHSRQYFSLLDRAGSLWLPGATNGLVRVTFLLNTNLGPAEAGTPNAGPAETGITNRYRLEFASLTVPWGVPTDFPLCALEDREGSIWVGSERTGLHQFRPKPLRTLGTAEGLPHESVWAAVEGRDRALWVGTDGGLAQLTASTTQRAWASSEYVLARTYSQRDGLCRHNIRALAQSADGTLWVGTARGLDLLRDGVFYHHWFASGEPVEKLKMVDSEEVGWNKFRVIYETRDGSVWVGGPRGLHRLREGQDVLLRHVEGFADRDVRALLETRDGGLWAGVADIGLTYLPPQVVANALITPGDLGGSPFSAVSLTNFPQIRATNTQWPLAAMPWPGLPTQPPSNLIPKPSASFPQPPARCLTLSTTNGLLSNQVWTLYEDAEGVLWAGTESGLVRIAARPLPPGSASASAPENRQTLTNHASRVTRHDLSLTPFTQRHGLPGALVNCLMEDEFGDFWIGSEKGIYRVSKRELNDVAAGRAARVSCVTYDQADGMASAETAGGRSAPTGCKTSDGRLCFATPKGLVVLDPRTLRTRDLAPPPVAVRQVLADDEVIYGDGAEGGAKAETAGPGSESGTPRAGAKPSRSRGNEAHPPGSSETPYVVSYITGSGSANRKSNGLRLPPGRARVLEIHYTAPTFAAAEQARFKYQLEGYESKWHEVGARRVAYYTNLKPGAYRFRVQAANHHGIWNESGAAFGFSLAPFYWQTWWFWTLAGLGGAGLVTAVVYWRIWELKRTQRLQAAADMANERIRIAQDLHDGLGSGLTQLRVLAALAERERLNPQALDSRLGLIAQKANEAADTLRDVVWVARPQNATVKAVVERVCQHAEQHLRSAGIACRFDLPDSLPEISLGDVVAHNLYYAAREVLTNVLKHASATEVHVRAAVDDSALTLEITDNGKGIAPSSAASDGVGLHSMRKRLESVGGRFELAGAVGQGTRVALQVKFKETVGATR